MKKQTIRAALALSMVFAFSMPQPSLMARSRRATTRLDLPLIAKKVKREGFADYIPIAYKTIGLSDEFWIPVGNQARAHCLLYMARDCSHFVFKWEIPPLIPVKLEGGNTVRKKMTPVRQAGPGGPQILSFRSQKRNMLLHSYSGGYMKRSLTKNPLTRIVDRLHETRVENDEFKWGAMLFCGIYLTPDDATRGAPIAIYKTDTDGDGDPLSGFAVMEVPAYIQSKLKSMASNTALSSVPKPIYWELKVNMASVVLKNRLIKLKKMYVQYDKGTEMLFTVCDGFIFGLENLGKESAELLINASLEIAQASLNAPSPWDIVRWIMLKPLEKTIENYIKIYCVSVLHMSRPEPIMLSPWTFVSLRGPTKGKDTWDLAEMQGALVGNEGFGTYEYAVAAGSTTFLRARLSTRPSVITNVEAETYGWYELETKPNSISIKMERTNKNWERIDKHLVENYTEDGVNAPCFLIVMHPRVNYEIAGQEAIRIHKGEPSSSSSFSRTETFHSESFCVGAEKKPLIEKLTFDKLPKRAGMAAAATSMKVKGTFVSTIKPARGFHITKQKIDLVKSDPLQALGIFAGGKTLTADMDERWWYRNLQLRKSNLKKQADYWRQNASMRYRRWQEQTNEQIRFWKERMKSSLNFEKGHISFAPPVASVGSSSPIKNLRIRYIPEFQGVHFKEPINWNRLLLKKTKVLAESIPELNKLSPRLIIDDDHIMIRYTNPKTNEEMGIYVRKPAKRNRRR